jgi:transcriptional antiterminator RfaH
VPDCRQLADELRRIHHLIRSGLPVHREAELEPGRRVRLRTGPLRGHEGILIKRHGKRHLLVAISFIQQGASVLLDDYDVELID